MLENCSFTIEKIISLKFKTSKKYTLLLSSSNVKKNTFFALSYVYSYREIILYISYVSKHLSLHQPAKCITLFQKVKVLLRIKKSDEICSLCCKRSSETS